MGGNCHGQWQQNLQEIFAHPDIGNAQVAVSVRSMDGHVLYERGSNILLIPASTLKTITTLSAIGILGPDFQYSTGIYMRGEMSSDGTLYGDIIIQGSGDPSLGSNEDGQVIGAEETIVSIVNAIKGKGITCINGQVLIDDSIFDQEAVHPGWPWDDLCNYYASGIWGLNFNENRYKVIFERSMLPNQKTKIKIINPLYPNLILENKVSTGPLHSYDEAYIYGDPYGVHKYVSGTIPPGTGDFEIEGAVPNGAVFFGSELCKGLQRNQINVKGYGTLSFDDLTNVKKITSIVSPPLRDLVKYALIESDNLYCDVFLKTISAQVGAEGTWKGGTIEINNYLLNLGVETSGYKQVDGSGLSARNRISASFMTDFLLSQVKIIGIEELKLLLPKVGVAGTVKNFLKGKSVQSHAWLKSGSINAVVAYAGILETAPGQHVLISISSNGHQVSNSKARKQVERIIETIYVGMSAERGR